MPRNTQNFREFSFTIDAFTPDTIPMIRLAEYMVDFAVLLGSEQSVHPGKLKKGSTILTARVEWEAEPKVRERLLAVRNRTANDRVLDAAARLDDRLAKDNAKGNIIDPLGSKVIEFPGRDRFAMPEYGPIQQPGSFQGVPIKVGGENDPVPVHLEDGKEKYVIDAKRSLAKEIAKYLFTNVVRIDGIGRWMRTSDGTWKMLSFRAESMQVIEDADLRKNLGELRSIDSAWKKSADPLKTLEKIRRGIS